MLNHLRISQRFLGVMGLFWVAFLAMAVTAVWGLFRNATELDEVAEVRMVTVNRVNELIKTNLANRAEVLLMFQHAPDGPLLSIHDHALSLHLDNFAKRRSANDELWPQIVAAVQSDPKAKPLAAQTDERRKAWIASIEATVTAVRSGDFSAPTMAAFLASGRREGQALIDALEALRAHEEQLARETANEAQALSRRILAAFVALALLVGAPATWMFFSLLARIRGGFTKADELATAIADGDLRLDIAPDGRDEIGHLLGQMQHMRTRLLALIREVRQTADGVQVAASEVADGNMDLSTRTEQTASNLQQTASTTDELSQTVRQNADNAAQANQLAQGASEVAGRGGQVVGEVVQTMRGIQDSSRRIADIIGTIDGIAFQTNILALNAAVEAAREIKSLISASVEHVEQGTQLVDRAGITMGEVVAAIERVTGIVGEISVASAEQSQGVAQVGASLGQMDQATQQNAALVEQSAAAAASLRDQATQLVQAVAGFRLP